MHGVIMAQGLIADLLPRKLGFDPDLVLVRFVMDIGLGQVLTRVFIFSPTPIVLSMLRSHFCSHAAHA
jgi:hypothetical protein